MTKDLLNYNLIMISEQLTTEQIIHARRFRNWRKFDKLEREDKIIIRYYHHTREKDKYISKNSSYSFPKERVIEELRDAKLRQLFD